MQVGAYPMGYKKEHRLACYLVCKSQIGLTKTSTYGGLMKCSLSKRPVLLLVDGHKAHVTQDAIEAVP